MATRRNNLVPGLAEFIEGALPELDQIPPERQKTLLQLTRFVDESHRANQPARLTFICTHNSRRSHMAQLWAQVAALHFEAPHVQTFSGGTEATAFNPRAVAAMRRAGFRIETPTEGDNPVYRVSWADPMKPVECFSKVHDQAPNPQQEYCAVMTCSHADTSCPVVVGAAVRVAIPYDDPKDFDGSDQEESQYDARCRQIAREMLFVFSRVKWGVTPRPRATSSH